MFTKISFKDIAIPLIVAIIAFLGTSLTVIVSALFRPDISIDVMVDDKSPHKVDVTLNNKGYAPATKFGLTMEFPHTIGRLNIFSTEIYNHTNSTSNLRVNIPRLVQGEGAVMRIEAMMSPSSKIGSDDRYNIYGTYDQGSIKRVKFILPQPELSLTEKIKEFWASPTTGYILIVEITVSAFISPLIYRAIKRKVSK